MFGPGPLPGHFERDPAVGDVSPPSAGVLVAAYGPAGAGTFLFGIESGSRVTLQWLTEIISTYSGREQRISHQQLPSLRIDGRAFLIDADERFAAARLMRGAASGATFLMALPIEESIAIADLRYEGDQVVQVGDTSGIDWAQPGQRVALLSPTGQAMTAVVQGTTPSTILLDVAGFGDGGTSMAGVSIVPLVPVLLESQQQIARHPVRAAYWDIKARSTSYTWAGVLSAGAGATVATLDGPVAADELTDDSLIVWDRLNEVAGTANDVLATRAEIVDLGGPVFAIGGAAVPDWIRPIRLRTVAAPDRQWLKAVLYALRGAQGAFLLPAWRDSWPVVDDAFARVRVLGDVSAWWPSRAHRRVVVTSASGVVQYAEVVAVDGVEQTSADLVVTSTLSLSAPVVGPVASVVPLELVRLESDAITMSYDGGELTCDLAARAIQDDTTTGDIMTTAHAGAGLDGNVTLGPGTTTLTRSMNYETLQLSSGTIIDTAGFVLRARTAIIYPPTGTAYIQAKGNDATGATRGAGRTGGYLGTSGGGASGGTGVGASATPVNIWPMSLHPGEGGAGGNGIYSGGPQGGGAVAPLDETLGDLGDVLAAVRMRLPNQIVTNGGAGGASGGGNGSASGGGGGGGAPNMVVAAGAFIANGSGALIIRSIGGAGGAGAGVDCGGGGGGGGGNVVVVAGRLPIPPTIQSLGGAGGASGGGSGVAGSAGLPGTVLIFVG